MMTEKLADLLVVDSDDRTRGPEERWMRHEGYDGHCLSSGLAALEFLRTYRPRYAVLDLTTLGDQGLDVLAAIRHQPRLRDLSLVIHVAVPAPTGNAGGFQSIPYLPHGIDWATQRAESDRYRH